MAPAPSIILTTDPPGPQFLISADCEMPVITAIVTLQNIEASQMLSAVFDWTVNLTFIGAGTTNSSGAVTRHTVIKQTTKIPRFVIPFTQIRGGALEINVSSKIGSGALTATSRGLTVGGVNPSTAALKAETLDKPTLFRKLLRHESGLRQFIEQGLYSGYPLFSGDRKLGVGLAQITPFETPEQVWSWKENLAAGWSVWQEKMQSPTTFPGRIRNGSVFRARVKAWNDNYAKNRVPAALSGSTSSIAPSGHGGGGTIVPPSSHGGGISAPTPIPITLPEFEADQLARDTVRGYNGYSGGYHEYRVKLDKDGRLVVTLTSGGARGAAEWERITSTVRQNMLESAGIDPGNWGDLNYVENVEAQNDI